MVGGNMFSVPAIGQQHETKIETQTLEVLSKTRIGVIDVESVLRRSLVWQDFLNKVDAKRVAAQKDIVKRQALLEREGQSISVERTNMS